jgi:hypothetical protein
MLRRFFTPLLLMAALLASADARAQSPADVALARELFREGAKFTEEKRWNDARLRFERALALKRSPLILYNLGVTYQNLGRLVDALEFFRAFLAEMQPNKAEQKAQEQPARDAVATLEKRVAKLDITIQQTDIEKMLLTVDGIIVPEAAWGYPRLVDPGEHKVVVQADGYREATQMARVTEGQQLVVTLELELLAQPKKVPDKPGMIGPDKHAVPVVPTVLVASGSVAFAVGLTVGLVGVQKASDSPTRDGEDATSARRFALAGDIVGGIGIAAAGAGLTLLLIDKFGQPAKRSSKAASVWVRPVVSMGSVGFVGRF